MTHRNLTLAFAAGRLVFAAALAGAPRATTGTWLGNAADRPGGRVAVRGLVARDAILSAGVALAAARGSATRPWLAACVGSDLSDIAATLADRQGLPDKSAPATMAWPERPR